MAGGYVKATSGFNAATVELWLEDGGGLYLTVNITKSVRAKLNELEAKAQAETDEDLEIDYLGQLLDLVLEKKGKAKDTPEASVLLKRLWDEEVLGIGQVWAAVEDVLVAGARPT